jgi:hypothetical protein
MQPFERAGLVAEHLLGEDDRPGDASESLRFIGTQPLALRAPMRQRSRRGYHRELHRLEVALPNEGIERRKRQPLVQRAHQIQGLVQWLLEG